MKLMVLDGNSLVNRAFFGIKLLTTKDGRYTNAIYGFQNILLNLLAAHQPDAVAIAWDERAPTFRHNAYDGYKATRHGMPEELAQQMPVLKELLTVLGFVQVSKAGWEADDILGTLAAACEAAGGTTLLATGDRDSLQLVDDATTVLLATNKETIPMDPAAIREKYGIEPPQLIDVKSLMGDSSDNIPGVPGIGEKTALALISKFGSLQGVYDNIEDKAVKPGQRAKLTANRGKADLSYMLGTIRRDAPIETDPSAYIRRPGDPAAAAQLLAALEMHKLVDRWGLESGAAPAAAADAAPVQAVEPSPLPLLLEGRFYAAQNVTKTGDGSWYLVQGSEVYLPDTDRLAALLDGDAEIWAFDAKPLYRLALAHGGVGKALRFDGKLAAYLLNPSASGYERPYSPVIDEILKYRTYAKLLSTYVDGLLNAEAADGRVHSTFIQTEARTGRISSTEPNLQNIPIRTELGSRLRGYFVAGEGETLVDADYSQIELRILAHITGDEHMQQAFLNGADIHRSTAAKIYHIPESEVTPQLRSASKAINFGIMYGKGAYSLSKDLGISVKEADSFLKTYLDTFPKVDSYMKDCIAHAKDKGYVETLFGRRRALPELASSNFQVRASGERMARNTPIQGTAADIIKLAMVHVWQRLREEKLQARLLLQVHDELIVEAPEAECDEVKRILKEEMENVVHYSVPLTTEVGTGKTWLAAH